MGLVMQFKEHASAEAKLSRTFILLMDTEQLQCSHSLQYQIEMELRGTHIQTWRILYEFSTRKFERKFTHVYIGSVYAAWIYKNALHFKTDTF